MEGKQLREKQRSTRFLNIKSFLHVCMLSTHEDGSVGWQPFSPPLQQTVGRFHGNEHYQNTAIQMHEYYTQCLFLYLVINSIDTTCMNNLNGQECCRAKDMLN